MIKATPGGWEVMAAALGVSRQSLENRIYERKGQSVTVELAQQMQTVSGTTLWADKVAADSGGCFVALPDCGPVCNEDLRSKFNGLYAEIGHLSETFEAATKDDDINRVERRNLERVGNQINRKTLELLALAFKVFCDPARGAQ
jgi:hypothetical protein